MCSGLIILVVIELKIIHIEVISDIYLQCNILIFVHCNICHLSKHFLFLSLLFNNLIDYLFCVVFHTYIITMFCFIFGFYAAMSNTGIIGRSLTLVRLVKQRTEQMGLVKIRTFSE